MITRQEINGSRVACRLSIRWLLPKFSEYGNCEGEKKNVCQLAQARSNYPGVVGTKVNKAEKRHQLSA